MQALLGRLAGTPEDVLEVQRRWSGYRAATAARPAYRAANPIIKMQDERVVAALCARPDLQALLAGLQWRPAMVNLKKVLSFQRFVNTDGLDHRVAAALQSEADLLRLCLPDEPPLPSSSAISMDADQRGITVTSLNPNLRLAGIKIDQVQVSPSPGLPPVQMLQVGLLVSTSSSYVQVVHYQNRYFLRDGYHRTAGLLRAGISTVPCVLIEARALSELGLQPGLFSHDVIFSERPPRLTDFWDDAVACDVAQPAARKVVRVQGSDFVVPR